MEHENLLPYSQEPAIGPYLSQMQAVRSILISSRLHLGLQVFRPKFCMHVICPMRTTYLIHLITPVLITLINICWSLQVINLLIIQFYPPLPPLPPS